MELINNWYVDELIAIIFANHYKRKIFNLPLSHNNNEKLPLFKYENGKTLNLLPSFGYGMLYAENFEISMLNDYLKIFKENNVTAVYLPFQSKNKFNDQLLSERLPSYLINLNNSIPTLYKNISKRRRTKLNLNKNSEFVIDTNELYDRFPLMYQHNMLKLNIKKQFLLDTNIIKKICKHNNSKLIGIKIKGTLEIIHLLGLSNDENRAEFIFSASTDTGRNYSSLIIWETIKYLSDWGFREYHLGGGIKKDDGLDEFKRQFGGEKIYNYGIKIVCDEESFKNQCQISNSYSNKTNFFPPYLQKLFI